MDREVLGKMILIGLHRFHMPSEKLGDAEITDAMLAGFMTILSCFATAKDFKTIGIFKTSRSVDSSVGCAIPRPT